MLDAERLRLRRTKERLTQKELGEAIGQDQTYMSRLERGVVTEITIQTLERLADALYVSTDYLLGRTKKNEPDLVDESASTSMIWNAKSLQRAVKELQKNEPECPESDLHPLSGKILACPVLLSLATEIALKAWQCRERKGTPVRSHDLLKLFEGLESSTQELLAQGLSGEDPLLLSSLNCQEYPLPFPSGEQSIPRVTVLREILKFHRNSFKDWRYLHENTHNMRFYDSALDRALTAIIDAYDKRWGDSA